MIRIGHNSVQIFFIQLQKECWEPTWHPGLSLCAELDVSRRSASVVHHHNGWLPLYSRARLPACITSHHSKFHNTSISNLNSLPLENWRRPPGRPCITWNEDYPAGPEINEPLPERSNWRGSESPTLEIDVYVWRYTLIVVHARNEWMISNDHKQKAKSLESNMMGNSHLESMMSHQKSHSVNRCIFVLRQIHST